MKRIGLMIAFIALSLGGSTAAASEPGEPDQTCPGDLTERHDLTNDAGEVGGELRWYWDDEDGTLCALVEATLDPHPDEIFTCAYPGGESVCEGSTGPVSRPFFVPYVADCTDYSALITYPPGYSVAGTYCISGD